MLASTAIRSNDKLVLSIAAGLVILSTALFDGPLAAYHRVSRMPHRAIDIVLAVIGIGAAFSLDLQVATRFCLILAALIVAFMSVRFSHVIREAGS